MPRVPFNPKIGRIRTDGLEPCDRSFLAHYECVPAADADDAIGVFPLTDEVQEIKVGLNQPDIGRNIKIKGSAAGITGNVVITGVDMAGDVIEETIAVAGTATDSAPGEYAFAGLTKIKLPVAYNAAVKQEATVEVTAVTTAGSPVLAFISRDTGASFDVVCELEAADVTTPTAAAEKIAAVLNATEKFAEVWEASNAAAVIKLKAKAPAAQDATVALTVGDADDTGLTVGSMTVAAVSGVAPDAIKVGIGKRIGIPYRLDYKEQVLVKMTGGTADGGTVVADPDDLCKNVLPSNKTINGTNKVDLYIIV